MDTACCPKCGLLYELHPLMPSAQELCPVCRNKASWDEIRKELDAAGIEKSKSAAKAGEGRGRISAGKKSHAVV